MAEDYNPQLTITVTEKQLLDLRALIPWGSRTLIFSPIIDDLIRLLKKDRAATLALLLSRDIKLEDYLQEAPNGDDRQSDC